MVEPLSFQSKGVGFDPWLGNEDPSCCAVQPRNYIFLKKEERVLMSWVLDMQGVRGSCESKQDVQRVVG